MMIRRRKRKEAVWALAVLVLTTVGGGPTAVGAGSGPADKKSVAALEILSDYVLITELAMACGRLAQAQAEAARALDAAQRYQAESSGQDLNKMSNLELDLSRAKLQSLRDELEHASARREVANNYLHSPLKPVVQKRFRLSDDNALVLITLFVGAANNGAKLYVKDGKEADLFAGCNLRANVERKRLSSRPWWKFW